MFVVCDVQERVGSWYSNPGEALHLQAHKAGVGKYMQVGANEKEASAGGGGGRIAAEIAPVAKRRKEVAAASGFGNFSNW